MQLTLKTKAGRVFELEAVLPYTRKDGSASALSVWRGTCRQCGTPFEVTTSANLAVITKTKSLSVVHCPDHRVRRRPKATAQPGEGVSKVIDPLPSDRSLLFLRSGGKNGG